MAHMKYLALGIACLLYVFLPTQTQDDSKMQQAFSNLCKYLGKEDNYTAMAVCMEPVLFNDEIMEAVNEAFQGNFDEMMKQYSGRDPELTEFMNELYACKDDIKQAARKIHEKLGMGFFCGYQDMTGTMFPDHITKMVMKQMGVIMGCFKDYGIGMKEMMG